MAGKQFTDKVEIFLSDEEMWPHLTREALIKYCREKDYDCKKILSKGDLISLASQLMAGETPEETYQRRGVGRPGKSPSKGYSRSSISDEEMQEVLRGEKDDKRVTKEILCLYISNNSGLKIRTNACRDDVLDIARQLYEGKTPSGPALAREKAGRPSKKPKPSEIEIRLADQDETLTSDEMYSYLAEKGADLTSLEEECVRTAAYLVQNPMCIRRKELQAFLSAHGEEDGGKKEKTAVLRTRALKLLGFEIVM